MGLQLFGAGINEEEVYSKSLLPIFGKAVAFDLFDI